jgi:hypothetical protein
MSTTNSSSSTEKKSGTADATSRKDTELNTDHPLLVNDADNTHIEASLFRLTAGLPKRELRLMVQEASECEALLLEDIRILKQALSGGADEDETALSIILESPLTPLDRYWTASALLGRLRQDMMLPTLLSAKSTVPNNNKVAHKPHSAAEEYKSFQELTTLTNPIAKLYLKETIPAATLLAVWKKISSNRAASVFKRPVRSEEAPGYAERILFPMDLSLIRKQIVTNHIQTYVDLHTALGLISHNCVKYNGA